MYLTARNCPEDALQEIRKALTLDPLSVPVMEYYADVCMNLRKFEEAKEYYEKALDFDPTFRNAWYGLGWVNILMQKYSDALDIFLEIQSQTENPLKGITPLGYLYGIMGRTEDALECIKKLERRKELEPNISLNFDFAIVHMGLKNYDKVFEYLDYAYEERSGGLIFLHNIYWQQLHNNPRFHSLMKKVGLE
jgi:tetratricopeptide (TPR) repeat protein